MAAESDLLERYATRGHPRGADSILAHARKADLPLYATADEQPNELLTRRRILAVAAAVTILLAGVSGLAARRVNVTDTIPGAPDHSATSSTTIPGPTPEELEAANRRRDELAANGWVTVGYGPAIPGEPIPEIAYRKAPVGNRSIPFYVTDAKGIQRIEVYDQPDGQVIGYYYGSLGIISKSSGDDPTFDVGPLYRNRGICEPSDQACVRDMNARNAPPTDPRAATRR
jgi:hypothetical protein